MKDKDYIKALEEEVARQDEVISTLEKGFHYLQHALHSEKVKHGQTKAILKRVLGR